MNLHYHIMNKMPAKWKTALGLAGLLTAITLYSTIERPLRIHLPENANNGTIIHRSLLFGRYKDSDLFFAGLETIVRTTAHDPNCGSGWRETTETLQWGLSADSGTTGFSHCQ